jgi:hypothetical protein
MSCEECERLSRAEIEATRQAADAEADPYSKQEIVLATDVYEHRNPHVNYRVGLSIRVPGSPDESAVPRAS